jgi:peptidoglycan/LPS O-acetylase OafA/YrhL
MIKSFIARVAPCFRRVPSGGVFIAEIDGLRFIAISAVLLVHIIAYSLTYRTVFVAGPADQWLRYHYEGLARGVELFFVISGFVIAAPFVHHYRLHAPAVDVGQFYQRRLTRLEPPFLLAMLVTYAALVLVHDVRAQPLLPHLLATCIYSHGIIYNSKSTIAFITWSLEIEIQFYLLAPLILRMLSFQTMIRRSSLLAFAGLSLLLDRWLAASPSLSRVTFFHYLPLFIAGIAVCDAALPNGCWRSVRCFAWDAIGFVALASAFFVPVIWTAWLLPFLFGLAVICGFRGVLLSRSLSHRWVTTIGGMCYSIYLVHEPLICFFGKLTSRVAMSHSISVNASTQAVLLVLPVLFCSALFFVIIEKPCMNKHWPRRLVEVVTTRLWNGNECLKSVPAQGSGIMSEIDSSSA